MKKYFDMSLPSAQILPTTISKVNTMVQLFLVAAALTAPIFNLADHPAYYALW
jgi:cardiolipin synthase